LCTIGFRLNSSCFSDKYESKVHSRQLLLPLVLSALLRREVRVGKIIHGDDHATLRVKIPALADQVRKMEDKIIPHLSNNSPPDLILNRHCPECEFRDGCRQKAIEKASNPSRSLSSLLSLFLDTKRTAIWA